LTEAHLQELWRLSPEPVLCFDGDTAGQRAMLRALHRALPLLQPARSLRFAVLPSGEDPDSLVRNGGSPAFAEILGRARPLSEMLWQSQLAARPIDTPERRADLERRVMADAALIADRAVQFEYRRFFRERLFALGRPTAKGGPRFKGRGVPGIGAPRAAISGVPRADETPPPLPRPSLSVWHGTSLGVLLRHPFLVYEISEELLKLDLGPKDPELERLQTAILGIEREALDLDAGALHQHLCEIGLVTAVDAALSAYARHAGLLIRNPDPDSVRAYWTDLIGRIRAREEMDVKTAADDFGRVPSEESSQRLIAALERKAQEEFAASDSLSGPREQDPR
jgi:DNA primase